MDKTIETLYHNITNVLNPSQISMCQCSHVVKTKWGGFKSQETTLSGGSGGVKYSCL